MATQRVQIFITLKIKHQEIYVPELTENAGEAVAKLRLRTGSSGVLNSQMGVNGTEDVLT